MRRAPQRIKQPSNEARAEPRLDKMNQKIHAMDMIFFWGENLSQLCLSEKKYTMCFKKWIPPKTDGYGALVQFGIFN